MVIDLPWINKYLGYVGLALVVIIETNVSEEYVKISFKLMRKSVAQAEYLPQNLTEGVWIKTE